MGETGLCSYEVISGEHSHTQPRISYNPECRTTLTQQAGLTINLQVTILRLSAHLRTTLIPIGIPVIVTSVNSNGSHVLRTWVAIHHQ